MSAMFSNNSKNQKKQKEKSFVEIAQIIFRRRYILVGALTVSVLLAILYNAISTPVYKSTGVLKKEEASQKRSQGDFANIIDMQTRDEIETEMELVKTWNVLSNVVDELYLNVAIKKVETKAGTSIEVNEPVVNFNDPAIEKKYKLPFELPKFLAVLIKQKKESAELYLTNTRENEFEIRDAVSNQLLSIANTGNEDNGNLKQESLSIEDTITSNEATVNKGKFNLPIADIEISWENVPIQSRVYFSITNLYKSIENLKNRISVGRKGKTNVFEVSVTSTSSFAASMIVNKIIEKFRESRIEQQKQTIRYSFKFVDDQLEEMQGKLKEAEDNLSAFKSSGQITTIDQSSRELVQFLSKLEAEKVNTDLLIADYQNKISEIKNEMNTSGYVDQSFLSPNDNSERGSPFSALLKQLSDLELQKLELLQKRTENHPDVRSIDEQIYLAKEKLSSYNQNTLTAYQIIINSLEKKLLKINNLMSKYEVKLEMLPAKENRLARLMRQKNVYEKINTLLLDKREEMRIAELSKLQDIAVVDQGHEPLTPISPKKIFNLLVSVIFGGFIGFIVVFLFELKDSKLISLDVLEEEFNLPVFAIIPTYSNLIKNKIKNATDVKDRFVTLMDEQEGFRETYRLLKTKLLFQMEGREKIFMITSCEENTGKTTIISNLAISIAHENKRVLVIDCDLRKAALSKLFDVPSNAPGLIEFIERDIAPTIYTKVLKNIDILPAGGTREDSSHLLNSERMKSLFDAIDTSFYDYIVIDTPPVTRVVDTLVLGRFIKDAILIVRPGHSFKEAVLGGIQEMIQARIKLRGIVANAAEIKDSYYYKYRYSYGYGYSYSDKRKETSKKKTKITQAAV